MHQSLDRRLGNLNKTLVMVVRELNQINNHNNKDIVDDLLSKLDKEEIADHLIMKIPKRHIKHTKIAVEDI